MKYIISENSGAHKAIEAESIEDAMEQAREWSSEGDYDERVEVTCYARSEDGSESDSDTVEAGPEPEAPECADGHDHEFENPEWLVGCSENPGVWSTGGTAMTEKTVCKHCGCYQYVRHSGAQKNPGQLSEKVTYEEADERSLEYVAEELA